MKNNIIETVKKAIADYDTEADIHPENDNQCSEDAGWTSPVAWGGDGDGAAAGNIVRDVLCYMDADIAEANDLAGAGWYLESRAINGHHVSASGWKRVSAAEGIELFRRAMEIDRKDRQ